MIGNLRRVDVELGKGKKFPEVCKVLQITEQTYCRWRQKYAAMAPEMAQEENSHWALASSSSKITELASMPRS